ncbi:MAG: hypothetical protein ABI624_16665 [Casimicrobiaceae bacterium]
MNLSLVTLALPRPQPFGVWLAHDPKGAAATFLRASLAAGHPTTIASDRLGGIVATPDGHPPLVFVGPGRSLLGAMRN